MLPSLSVLYDRILTARLETWLNVSEEQTGSQKGKSTLQQIFIIRILIGLVKSTKKALYIGCFDIEKAFDKVSRVILLQRLVTCGIGYFMLHALKCIYSNTFCILSMNGKYSSRFETKRGIRQGAPSSSWLFIEFIDDVIKFLRDNCDPEPLLNTEYIVCCTLTTPSLLVHQESRLSENVKCKMKQYFDRNKLTLNLGKSGYIIINGKRHDDKCTLELDDGQPEYKNKLCYLGVMIGDKGNIKQEIRNSFNEKKGNITVKFTNVCSKNYLAPLDVKLRVLNSCVVSSLLYSCETWADNIPNEIEVMYRIGIKTALNIRNSSCNGIVYVESGLFPLICRVQILQLGFWRMIQNNSCQYVTDLIATALELNNSSYSLLC